MKKVLLRWSVICLLLFVLCLQCWFVSAAGRQRYIYDSKGRRDPFIPLVDKTGFRTDFSPPEERVRLPFEVGIKGILWNGREYYAIINDEVRKKGQNLGDIKIKDIEKDKVVLEYAGKEFITFFKKEKKK